MSKTKAEVHSHVDTSLLLSTMRASTHLAVQSYFSVLPRETPVLLEQSLQDVHRPRQQIVPSVCAPMAAQVSQPCHLQSSGQNK